MPNSFGWLIAFGMIMVMPHLLEILQENLGTKSKHGELGWKGAIAGGTAAGGVAGAVGGGTWKMLTRTHPYSGEAMGPLAKLAARPGKFRTIAAPFLTHLGGWDPRMEAHQPGGGRGGGGH
jgi:hypothetical protein